MESLRAVGRTLLRDRAYTAIRDAIVTGEIQPGAVVRDAEPAERLRLSTSDGLRRRERPAARPARPPGWRAGGLAGWRISADPGYDPAPS
jgi:hypothetical protein